MAVADTHPDLADLKNFTLGTLDDASLAIVEAHIAGCPRCQEQAANASSDSLIELLRRVHVRPAALVDTVSEVASLAPIPNPVPFDQECPTLAAPSRVEPVAREGLPALPPELTRHERYRVLRLLGEGGMGAVYEAEHSVMQRHVALKVINRAFTSNAAAVERFHREVCAAARLSHPNIVTAYDAENVGGRHFLVMEYVQGISLARLVKERGPLPVSEACDYVRQAAMGLQHAHEHGMVHRDVKPDNLIRAANGQVKVLDFGLAALAAERGPGLTDANMVMGTPEYMAPEQAADARGADARSDVYSLGCTLYYLLTGIVPYPAATALLKVLAHRDQPVPALRRARPEAPPELAAIVARMMAKNPAARFQTAAEVAAGLEPFAKNKENRDPRTGKRFGWLIAAAVLGGFLVAGLAAAGAVYRVQTDKGVLVITTESDDVEVVIKQSGKVVRVIDTKTDKQITLALHSGTYELELKGAHEGLKLDIDKTTLSRGETVLAKIERELKPSPAEAKIESKEPAKQAPLAELPAKPGLVRTLTKRTTTTVMRGQFSPDGRLFALPDDLNNSDFHYTRIYETATGRFLRDVEIGNDFPSDYAFMPDNKHLLVAASPYGKNRWSLHLYNIETGEDRKLTHIEPFKLWPFQFRVSADGKRFTMEVGYPDGHLEDSVLDLETGQVLVRVPLEVQKPGQKLELNFHELTPDGKKVVYCFTWKDMAKNTYSGLIRIVEVDSKKTNDINVDGYVNDPFFPAEVGKISALRATKGGIDCVVETWDLATSKSVSRVHYVDKKVSPGMQLHQGRMLLEQGEGNRIIVVEMATGKEVYRSEPMKVLDGWLFSTDRRMMLSLTDKGHELYRLPDLNPTPDKP